MSDEAPDFIATVDQAASTVGEIARVAGSYYKALVAMGIDPRDATTLTIAYQALLVGAAG